MKTNYLTHFLKFRSTLLIVTHACAGMSFPNTFDDDNSIAGCYWTIKKKRNQFLSVIFSLSWHINRVYAKRKSLNYIWMSILFVTRKKYTHTIFHHSELIQLTKYTFYLRQKKTYLVMYCKNPLGKLNSLNNIVIFHNFFRLERNQQMILTRMTALMWKIMHNLSIVSANVHYYI